MLDTYIYLSYYLMKDDFLHAYQVIEAIWSNKLL